MNKDTANDRRHAAKILAHIADIGRVLELEKIDSSSDLAGSIAAKFAVTQLITNIYELTRGMQPATLQALNEFGKIRLRTTRQIASHDYGAMDFRLVYVIAAKLTSQQVRNELSNFIKEARNGNRK